MSAARFFLWVTFLGLTGLAVASLVAFALALRRRRDVLFPNFEEWRREQLRDESWRERFEEGS